MTTLKIKQHKYESKRLEYRLYNKLMNITTCCSFTQMKYKIKYSDHECYQNEVKQFIPTK